MNFRQLTVKEVFKNPATAAVIKELAPSLMKYPIAIFNNKSCGEIFDLVVSKKLLPEAVAKQIEERINEVLK